MIGRAGRPQFDTKGVACVMVEEGKKNFYKKFLYDPFPVESCFEMHLSNNLNAEVAIGTIKSIEDCVGYLDWTFFARRVRINPSYYGAKSSEKEEITIFFYKTVKKSVNELKENQCVVSVEDGNEILTTLLGITSSKFYLDFRTPLQMKQGLRLSRDFLTERSSERKERISESDKQNVCFSFPIEVEEGGVASILFTLAHTHEFDELPVRHNEEKLNMVLSENLSWGPDTRKVLKGSSVGDRSSRQHTNYEEIMIDPHTKCFLLIQAYIAAAPLPISDYIVDTKLVMEQIPRLLAAMEYITLGDTKMAGNFDLLCMFAVVRRAIKCKKMPGTNSLENLPALPRDGLRKFKNAKIKSLSQLVLMQHSEASNIIKDVYGQTKISSTMKFIKSLPKISVRNIHVRCTSEKVTGKSMGLMTFDLTMKIIQERKKQNTKKSVQFNCTIAVGTPLKHFLLARKQIEFNNSKETFSRKMEINFDWSKALSCGGEDQMILLRVLNENVGGLDLEHSIRLY